MCFSCLTTRSDTVWSRENGHERPHMLTKGAGCRIHERNKALSNLPWKHASIDVSWCCTNWSQVHSLVSVRLWPHARRPNVCRQKPTLNHRSIITPAGQHPQRTHVHDLGLLIPTSDKVPVKSGTRIIHSLLYCTLLTAFSPVLPIPDYSGMGTAGYVQLRQKFVKVQ